MKSVLYRAAAGLVGFGCVVGIVMLLIRWNGWSGSVVFALINLAAAAWFLLDYALRRPANTQATSAVGHEPSKTV